MGPIPNPQSPIPINYQIYLNSFMVKKDKAKGRLDQFYYLAKKSGFRSRAAFKIIQINKKYNFFQKASCLIDLCAAPGGWLQAANRLMPISSKKIGIDLDFIKPIPNVTTIQADITTEKCRQMLKKEMGKNTKADIVLHDGAPNVGGAFSRESYVQNELVIISAKLATEYLKEGGWFITKVFRSADYNSIIYSLSQLFRKVEATKPISSRNESAEIFVVCQGYLAPSSIDERLLDPRFALRQLEEEEDLKSNSINSIKALFAGKRHRSGYFQRLYVERTFTEFVKAENPYSFLYNTNKIVVTRECEPLMKLIKKREEIDEYLQDIKLLGKAEVQKLIICRNKVRGQIHKDRKKDKPEVEVELETEEQYEAKKMAALENEIKDFEKKKKKKREAEEKKKDKIELRQKMTFLNEAEKQGSDSKVNFDQRLFDDLRENNINIEDLEDGSEEESEEEEENIDLVELDDLSENDIVDMMNEEIEQNIDLHKNKKFERQGKRSQKVKFKEDEIETVARNEGEDEDEEAENEENESDEEDDVDLADAEDADEFSDISDEDFENPLAKRKVKVAEKIEDVDDEENESSDTENDVLGKKRQRANEDIEEISLSEKEDEYDSDEKAEIRAIAKKLLRKKEREQIINSTYSKWSMEGLDKAPSWFVDEEKKYNMPIKPVSREEIMAEKQELMKFNARMPLKVLQAKNRKKNKLRKKLSKVKAKAEVILNQEEVKEGVKMRNVDKLYKRELAKNKDSKKYIRSKNKVHGEKNKGRGGRNLKFVDSRMKKDKRALKAQAKRRKK